MNNKRTFIALKFNLENAVLNYINKIKNALPDEKINWVESSHFHLTLAFLGDTPEKNQRKIIAELQNFCTEIPTFKLELFRLGLFPNNKEPNVLWMGIEPSIELIQLKNKLDQSLVKLKVHTPEPNFRPHLTLGRIKESNLEKLNQVIDQFKNQFFQEANIDQIIYYESKLTPEGSVFSPINIYQLTGSHI